MSTTLLHFLANTVELRHPQLMDFVTELRNIEEASKSKLYYMLKYMYVLIIGFQQNSTYC